MMKIKELNLRNFRGFRELDIKFPSSNLAVFIGMNGSGKSSILDCISMFLSYFADELVKDKSAVINLKLSLRDSDINVSQKQISNTVTIIADSEDISWNIVFFQEDMDIEVRDDRLGRYIGTIDGDLKTNPLSNLPILAYYQTNRWISGNRLEASKIEKTKLGANQFFSYTNAFGKNMTDLSDFVSWFRFEEDLENEMKIKHKDFDAVNKKLEVVRRAISTFLNQFPACEFTDLHIERISGIGGFEFDPSGKSSLVIKKNGLDSKMEQLSAGEQIVLMMISDIARRLAIANPSLPDPLQGKGIVLIDEIELHLHPGWQREIIPCLLHTFPNIQFIVTTHSPQVLSNIEKEDVIILEDFRIVEKTPHTKGRDSNSVLYELMGVEERPEAYKNKLGQLYRLTDDEKFGEAKAILAELTEKFGEHDTEIVRANMYLGLAEDDGNEIYQKG